MQCETQEEKKERKRNFTIENVLSLRNKYEVILAVGTRKIYNYLKRICTFFKLNHIIVSIKTLICVHYNLII